MIMLNKRTLAPSPAGAGGNLKKIKSLSERDVFSFHVRHRVAVKPFVFIRIRGLSV